MSYNRYVIKTCVDDDDDDDDDVKTLRRPGVERHARARAHRRGALAVVCVGDICTDELTTNACTFAFAGIQARTSMVWNARTTVRSRT